MPKEKKTPVLPANGKVRPKSEADDPKDQAVSLIGRVIGYVAPFVGKDAAFLLGALALAAIPATAGANQILPYGSSLFVICLWFFLRIRDKNH